MKILFLIDTLQIGGAERSILEIARNLKDFEPIICTLYSDKNDLKPEYDKFNIPVYEFNLNKHSKFWFLEGKKAFEKFVRKMEPDVIHVHLYKSEIIARISNLSESIPLIGAFVNDSYSKERYEEQTIIRNFKLSVVRLFDCITAKKVNYFTSITKAIAVSNAKALKIDINKITTIYRGRSIENFSVVQPIYDINDRFVFLTVARLLKRKGYIELIDAIDKLKNSGKDFVCMIAGDGADADEIKLYASKKEITNNIEFLGNRDDVSTLLQKTHSFIFPSHYEGQGGALVEAMLAAKPIILSDIPVFREQITDMETGRFFDLKNPKDLSEKMCWMMENYELGKNLGLQARKYAINHFDIEKIASQYDSFYNKVLEDFPQ